MPYQRHTPILILIAASLLTATIYWQGLSGPFLMDDYQHLSIIQSWHLGQIGFWDMAAGNGNWLFHRSLAMISLAINVAVGGDSSFSLKLGNLLLHLLCGWIIYAVMRQVLLRDKNLHENSELFSALICSIWLLHPLNVSTVLYVVQRMSQIATIFPLLGVWLYTSVRNRMLSEKIKNKTAIALLIIGIPLFTFLGIQGKQSAIVLIGLCLVVELGWFQDPAQWKPSLRHFYILYLIIPSILIIILLAWKWDSLQTSMLEWGMTPTERLLSEPRALWGYIRMLVIPYSPAMGIYTDDFKVSHDWLDPITTLPSLCGLVIVSLAAVACRKKQPGIFVGWFWFLVAHSVEASVVPIELYYEHRNYLPQIGLWVMIINFMMMALNFLSNRGVKVRTAAWTLSFGFTLVICAQTWSRTLVWQSPISISLTALETHPNSARAHVAFGFSAMQAGLVNDTYTIFQRLAGNADPAIASIGKIELTVLNCHLKQDSDPHLLESAANDSPSYINPVMPYAISNLLDVREKKGCGRITPRLVAESIKKIIDQATDTREASLSKWTLRYNAALAYHQSGNWQLALQQTRIAWPHSPDPTIALFHVKLLLQDNDLAGAKNAFWQVMQRANYTKVSQLQGATRGTALRAIRKEINSYAIARGMPGIAETDVSPDT